jgi:hypothetical protein
MLGIRDACVLPQTEAIVIACSANEHAMTPSGLISSAHGIGTPLAHERSANEP